MIKAIKNRMRLWVQIVFTAVTNGYLLGFLTGRIYTGPTKAACVPGLNCYSCPGALGSCPIGSLQAVLGSRDYKFSFYVVGFLLFFGSIFGRFVCGWLCPFGLVPVSYTHLDHSTGGRERFLPPAGISRKRYLHGQDKAIL